MQIQAKKKFGQNFLKDQLILEKIIKSMSCENELVEIGPGLGDLTQRLLKVKNVTAFEVDNDLSVYLKEKFSTEIKAGKFKLIEEDVLSAWRGNLIPQDYDIVANLPYYIATAIILKALKDDRCKNLTLMIQKEVSEKFSANPKQKEFCALSVLCQSISHVKVLFDVPPCAFEPEPKVISSVISFKKFKNFDENIAEFEAFLRVAFSQPRKTLLKNLSSKFAKDLLNSSFSSLDLVSTTRPHEVDTLTYHSLFKMITKVKNGRK